MLRICGRKYVNIKERLCAMKKLSILTLMLLVAIAWGCEKSPTDNTTSATDEGPCPGETDSVTFTIAPEITNFVAPPYPDSSVANGHSGIVGINVLVGRMGGVQDAVVRNSSGHSELDALVREYAYQNTYSSGRNRTASVCMWMPYIVEFDPGSTAAEPQVTLVD